jgi:small subunit ribosomal protein S6
MATTRPYEIVIITDPATDDQANEQLVKRTVGQVTAAGGSVGKIERWGRRKLAYEIRKKTEGYYVLIEASAPPASIKEIDRQLMLADEVMRHKIIQIPANTVGRLTTNPPSLEEVSAAQRESRGDRGDRGDRGPRSGGGRGRDRADRD